MEIEFGRHCCVANTYDIIIKSLIITLISRASAISNNLVYPIIMSLHELYIVDDDSEANHYHTLMRLYLPITTIVLLFFKKLISSKQELI